MGNAAIMQYRCPEIFRHGQSPCSIHVRKISGMGNGQRCHYAVSMARKSSAWAIVNMPLSSVHGRPLQHIAAFQAGKSSAPAMENQALHPHSRLENLQRFVMYLSYYGPNSQNVKKAHSNTYPYTYTHAITCRRIAYTLLWEHRCQFIPNFMKVPWSYSPKTHFSPKI